MGAKNPSVSRWSIRTKIAVGTGVIVAVSWLLLVGFSFATTNLLLDIAAKQMFRAASRAVSVEIQQAYQPVERTTALLAVSKVVHARTEDERLRLVPFFAERLRDVPATAAIQVGDERGSFFIVRTLNDILRQRFEAPSAAAFVVDHIDGESRRFRRWFFDDALRRLETRELPPSPFDPRTRPWYRSAVLADDVIATPPYVFFFMQKMGVTLARASVDRRVVVAADITVDSMARALAAHRVTPSTEAVIHGPRGVLAWSGTETALVADAAGALRARRLDELGHPALRAVAASQEPDGWLVHRARLGIHSAMDAELIIAVPEAELLTELNAIRARVLLISFVVLGLLVPLTWLLADRIAAPLRDLHRAIRRVGEGDFDFGLPEAHTRDEVGDLNRALRGMQKSLRSHVEALAAATAARQRLRNELDVARRIQMGLVPGGGRMAARFDGAAVFGRLVPARAVGGDLYDIVPLSDGRLFVAVGDVSDKGIPAALLMSRAITLTRMLMPQSSDLGVLLRALNDELAQGNDECMFVTFFCAIVDMRSGEARYASAGHNAPLVVSGSEICPLAVEPATPLGIVEGSSYAESSISLLPGSRLVMYTDGITEAFSLDRRQFSEEGLVAAIDGVGAEATIDALGEAILRAVTEFADGTPQSDDITLLIVERTAAATGMAVRLSGGDAKVGDALAALRRFAERVGLPSPVTQDALVVVDEVVSNALRHGGGPHSEPEIEISARIVDGTLELRFVDNGVPFDPLAGSAPALDQPVEARQLGGLGLMLVRSLTDAQVYRRENDRNVLVVTRSITL